MEELHGKLTGTSDDSIHLPHGYVAVVNRDTKSGPVEISLAESAAVEEAAFSTMPVELRNRCGNAALMTRIVDLLCDYTSKTWAPLAVKEINAQISAQKLLLGGLGMSPSDAGLPQAAQAEAVLLFERAVSHPEVAAHQWPTFPPLQAVNDAGESLNATRAWNANKAAAENWLRDCLARANPGILSVVSADLRSHRKLPTALHRFHKLGAEIGTMLQRSIDRAHARVCTPDNIRRRFDATTAALEAINEESSLQWATTKLARMLRNEATIAAIDQFRNDLPQAFSVAGIFVEDSETSQKRRELTQLIAELTEVRELVESLSHA